MAYFPDLSPCTYFGDDASATLVAVGWLERGHPVPQGPVQASDFESLFALCQAPWQPRFVCGGGHLCTLCRFSHSASIMYKGVSVQTGHANVFVPSFGKLFVAPSSILHYIDVHEYAPPPEFLEAVELCPPMRSTDYLKQLLPLIPAAWRNKGS